MPKYLLKLWLSYGGLKLSVISVIWTHNPDKNLFDKVLLYASVNTDKVYVIDNGSSSIEAIQDTITKFKNVLYFRIPRNLGVAALNVGIELALKEKPQWILILDDDTILLPNSVKEVLEAFDRLPPNLKYQVCVISITDLESLPALFKNWIKSRKRVMGKFVLHNYPIIFSGSLIKGSFLTRYNVKIDKCLFLDHADTDFFEALRKKECLTLLYVKKLMKHRMGISLIKPITFLGIKFSRVTSHYRFYYIIRNSLYLLMRGRINLLSAALSIISYLPVLMVTHPLKTLKFTVLGVTHGLFKKLGVLDERKNDT